MKTGLGLVALLLPGGILLLAGWVLARARVSSERSSTGEPPRVWQVVSRLSFREVLREARAAT